MHKVTIPRKYCFALAPLLGLSMAHAASADVPAATPEAAVTGFYSAITNHDLKAATAFVVGANPELTPELKEVQTILKENSSEVRVREPLVKTTADKAVVTFKGIVEGHDNPAHLVDGQAILQLVGGSWQIAAVDDATLIKEVVHDDFPLDLLPAFLARPGTFYRMREIARNDRCALNLTQLALAVATFVNGHEGHFALNAATFHRDLGTLVKGDMSYFCPGDEQWLIRREDGSSDLKPTGPEDGSFSFNGRLTNVLLGTIKEPARVVMAYEGHDGKLDFRHDGKAHVAFVDTHVEALTEEQAKALRWDP